MQPQSMFKISMWKMIETLISNENLQSILINLSWLKVMKKNNLSRSKAKYKKKKK